MKDREQKGKLEREAVGAPSKREKKRMELWVSESEIQFNSVIQSCPTLCNPMDCSTPGFPIHQQLPELT